MWGHECPKIFWCNCPETELEWPGRPSQRGVSIRGRNHGSGPIQTQNHWHYSLSTDRQHVAEKQASLNSTCRSLPALSIVWLGQAMQNMRALVAHYVTVRLAYRYTMLNPHLYNHRLTSCTTREELSNMYNTRGQFFPLSLIFSSLNKIASIIRGYAAAMQMSKRDSTCISDGQSP